MKYWMRRFALLAALASAVGLIWLSAPPAHACPSQDGGGRHASLPHDPSPDGGGR